MCAGGEARMSALSNNLSELDQLLQDLNSAQFLADVDRKSAGTGISKDFYHQKGLNGQARSLELAYC